MIEVKYSCDKCGVKRASVMVVPRSPREDVVEFVNRAALQCKADHDNRSPTCEIDNFSEVMIPVGDDKSQPIGSQPTRQ
jgi:hypothetical protein